MTDKISIAILAAGLGTRMKSRKAKVLHEAGGMALVEHVVRSALTVAKAEDIVVVAVNGRLVLSPAAARDLCDLLCRLTGRDEAMQTRRRKAN